MLVGLTHTDGRLFSTVLHYIHNTKGVLCGFKCWVGGGGSGGWGWEGGSNNSKIA